VSIIADEVLPKISYPVDVCSDVAEIMSRIVRYLSGANHILPLPLSEVILTNKDKGYHVTSTFSF